MNSAALQPDWLTRALVVGWLCSTALSIRALLAVPTATWYTASTRWLGLWSLGTHLASVTLAPLAAVLVWRGRPQAHFVILVLAGNALLYWTFYVLILRSTYWPALYTLALALATLAVLFIRAMSYLGEPA
jgi:hypothetical protein